MIIPQIPVTCCGKFIHGSHPQDRIHRNLDPVRYLHKLPLPSQVHARVEFRKCSNPLTIDDRRLCRSDAFFLYQLIQIPCSLQRLGSGHPLKTDARCFKVFCEHVVRSSVAHCEIRNFVKINHGALGGDFLLLLFILVDETHRQRRKFPVQIFNRDTIVPLRCV